MAEPMKITYATLSADNEDLQSAYDRALATVKADWLGADVPMFIDGERVYTADKVETYSPINQEMLLCTRQNGDRSHTQQAIAAAKRSFPAWRATPWPARSHYAVRCRGDQP